MSISTDDVNPYAVARSVRDELEAGRAALKTTLEFMLLRGTCPMATPLGYVRRVSKSQPYTGEHIIPNLNTVLRIRPGDVRTFTSGFALDIPYRGFSIFLGKNAKEAFEGLGYVTDGYEILPDYLKTELTKLKVGVQLPVRASDAMPFRVVDATLQEQLLTAGILRDSEGPTPWANPDLNPAVGDVLVVLDNIYVRLDEMEEFEVWLHGSFETAREHFLLPGLRLAWEDRAEMCAANSAEEGEA